MDSTLRIVRCKGPDSIPYISDLAKSRIEIFKSYPYLYLGSFEYEQEYLKTYIQSPESVIIFVFDQDKIVGASTAIPLEFETDEVKKPFLDQHYQIQEVFYFGESVLQPEYRGRHIYQHFFKEREAVAKEYGSTIAAFCAVERSENDPRKPRDYISMDQIWNHFGYHKHPELSTSFEWTEIGQTTSSSKPMVFWLKHL